MTIISFLLSLLMMALLLILCLSPFLIVGVAVYFAIRHRTSVVIFFEKLITAWFSFYRRCWENASKKN